MSLQTISLGNNKIRSLDPKMFSRLSRLNILDLSGNICVDKGFENHPSKTAIENELIACGSHDQQSSPTTCFDEIEHKVNEKFEWLTKMFECNQQSCENKMDQKLEDIEKSIEKNRGKFEFRFGELEKKFDKRHEENEMIIQEMKTIMEEMHAILTGRK
jgi:hypothetical protein